MHRLRDCVYFCFSFYLLPAIFKIIYYCFILSLSRVEVIAIYKKVSMRKFCKDDFSTEISFS